MKKIFNILIFSVMGLALSLPLVAFAIPAFPMNFTGAVTINEEPAPEGSVIEVYGDIVEDPSVSGDVILADFTLTDPGIYGGARILAESEKVSIPEYTGGLTFRIASAEYDSGDQLADTSNTYTAGFSDFKDVDQTLAFTGATATAVVSIAVTPATPSIVAGGTQQFTATGTYADASESNVTKSCTWESATPAIATIVEDIGEDAGFATGVAKGSSVITATYTGLTPDTATLTVSVSVPTGLSASAASTSQINVSWTAMTGATSYKVYRAGVNVGLPTSNSYSDTGLTANTSYSYTVSAVNTDGETSQSSSVSATTESGGTSSPSGGGGATATVSMPTTTTGDVTATKRGGGKTTVTTSDGVEASVKIPAYAVSANTKVSVESKAATSEGLGSAFAVMTGDYTIVGNYVYEISASSSGSDVTEFSKKLTITLTYTDAQLAGLSETSLTISYWDTTEEKWFALPTTVDKATNTLTALTDHLTYFAILSGLGESVVVDDDVVKPVSEMTQAEIRAAIADIIVKIKQLQAILAQMRGEAVGVSGCSITSFDRSLKRGMSGSDVKCLQLILNSATDTRIASSGVGSPGQETNYFGGLTKAGVIKFQEKYLAEVLSPHGLTSGTGYVGTTTRAKLNTLLK